MDFLAGIIKSHCWACAADGDYVHRCDDGASRKLCPASLSLSTSRPADVSGFFGARYPKLVILRF